MTEHAVPPARLGRSVATLGGMAIVVPLVSFVVSPIVPVVLRAMVVALWLTAIASPHAGLIALVLLVPFGFSWLAAFDAPPVQYAEALVLAVLSAALINTGVARPERGQTSANDVRVPSIVVPSVLFSAVVVCSLAVVLALSQTGIGIAWPFVRSLATFLATDYLLTPSEQWAGIAAASRLLEGVMLLLVVTTLVGRDAERSSRHLLTAIAVSGGVAAVFAILQLASTFESAGAARGLATFLTSRVASHVSDTNAAGSFLAMTACVALSLGLRRETTTAWRRGGFLLAAAVVVALWFTGSRAAVAALAVVMVTGAAWTFRRAPWLTAPRLLTVLAIATTIIVIVVALDPRAVDRRGLLNTISERSAFVATGLGIIKAAPAFGIGIGRYFEASGAFMPQSIYWFHLRENAHNNFLQIGGELGLIGLAASLWLIGAAAVRLVRGLRAKPGDRLLAGGLSGLAAFVVTWMSGHPLLTPEVAFPFWMLLGASIARADGHGVSNSRSAMAAVGIVGRRPLASAWVVVLILAATVPVRIAREASALDLAGQSFGFYEWEANGTGRFRWTTPNASFFVPARTTELDVPFSAAWADKRRNPTMVTIRVDGRMVQKLQTTSGDWTVVELRLPPPSADQQYRRVDIATTPAWSPAEVLGTRDSRVLGVQVGEVIMR